MGRVLGQKATVSPEKLKSISPPEFVSHVLQKVVQSSGAVLVHVGQVSQAICCVPRDFLPLRTIVAVLVDTKHKMWTYKLAWVRCFSRVCIRAAIFELVNLLSFWRAFALAFAAGLALGFAFSSAFVSVFAGDFQAPHMAAFDGSF